MNNRMKLTKAEAGRLGGKATVKKYGPEHIAHDRQGRFRGEYGASSASWEAAAGEHSLAEQAGEDPRRPGSGPGEPDLSRTVGATGPGRRARGRPGYRSDPGVDPVGTDPRRRRALRCQDHDSAPRNASSAAGRRR